MATVSEGEEQEGSMEESMAEDAASSSSEEISCTRELGNGSMEAISKDAKPSRTVIARQTAVQNPMLMDAMRRTRLGLKGGEVTGRLTFVVPKGQALDLPTASVDNPEGSIAAAVRETLCRRFEALHPSRKEDDVPYFDAVENGIIVTLVAALPPGYDRGGWRCHAKTTTNEGQMECLLANSPEEEQCARCRSPKPKIRTEFFYLRLLAPGMRRQRREYERILNQCDDELDRCDAAEREATDRIAAFDRESDEQHQQLHSSFNITSDIGESSAKNIDESTEFEAEEELMMDVDLQEGIWQRIDARTLLPMLATRKGELRKRLANARAELSIMIQAAYNLAVPHIQRVTRRFLVRCRLDEIRKSKLDFARFSAAVEMQRVLRSMLACREADRLRILRNHSMATRIQSIARRRFAVKERKRLFAIYMEKLRNRSAVIIQSLYRCHASRKLVRQLAEERRRLLEELEKARVASLEKDSATTIQKHYRRLLATVKCANRRIELGMHQRLLMYLERYAINGCLWSFVKSINNDYHRYERTITHTIEREERMAKTFVEKVINTRDGDHSLAWENYIHFAHVGDHGTSKDNSVDSSNKQASSKGEKGVERHSRHRSTIDILYGSPHHHRSISSRKSQTRKATPKRHKRTLNPEPIQGSSADIEKNPPLDERSHHYNGNEVEESETDKVLGRSYRQEAKRLASLEQLKDKLKGKYLRFDIPDGLDDTASRFIMAVTLRHKFETPGNSELASPQSEHQLKCMLYAEPLIQHLHGKGIVFIRQLLPADKMSQILSSFGVADDFLLISRSLLNVLHLMTRGNYLNRKYLMTKCRHLLDTQKQMNGTSPLKAGNEKNTSGLTSFLGECGAAGSDNYDDDDNPGGLWIPRVSFPTETQADCKRETNKRSIHNHIPRKMGTRSWVLPYTAKIIAESESKHPALKPYRHGQLLDHHNSYIMREYLNDMK